MPITKLEHVTDPAVYKVQIAADVKADTPSAKKFFFFKKFKGPKDSKPRNILLLNNPNPDLVKAVSALCVTKKYEGTGTYTKNTEGKLVFDPPSKAKAISASLTAVALPNKVQLAPGETEGDEDEGTDSTTTATTTPTTGTPPQGRPRSDSTPPPPVNPPTPPSTPPPQAPKPVTTAPLTPPPPTPKPGGTAPTTPPPLNRPAPTTPPPPIPQQKPAPTGPTPTGWKPGVAPTPKPGSTAPTTPPPPIPQKPMPTGPTTTGWKAGVTPPPPSTKPPVPPTAPLRPGTTAPTTPPPQQEDGPLQRVQKRLTEVQASVKAAIDAPAVPPAVKANLQTQIKNIEILLKAKPLPETQLLEKLEEIEKKADLELQAAGTPRTKQSSADEEEIKKVLAELKTLMDEITAADAIPAENKTQLASAYKAAINLRDVKQFDKALAAFKKVQEDASTLLFHWNGPQTEEVTAAQAKKDKKLTPKERLHERAVANNLIESQIQSDILLSEIDLPEIEEIMTEQRAYVPREMKAFQGLRSLEDIGRIRDPKKRQERLQAMDAAFKSANDREKRFVAALAKIKDKDSDAYKSAQGIRNKLLDHIPDGFMAERRSLGSRLEVLGLDPAEKKTQLDDLLKVKNPDPALKKELDDERDAIMAAVEYGSLKAGERTQFYFDAPVKSITKEQGVKMQAAYDKAIARAYKIRDLGGSPADAEAALAHIPPDFWPPAFIETLQAWRKVERELADERVAEMFKKDIPLGLNKATAKKGLKMVSELFSNLNEAKEFGGDIGDFAESVGHASDVIGGAQKAGSGAAKGLGTISSIAGKVQDLAPEITNPLGDLDKLINNDELADAVGVLLDVANDLNDELKEKLKEGDMSELSDKQLEQGKDWLDRMAQAGSGVKTVIGHIVDLKDAPGMEATNFAVHVCPILSIVATGIDIGLAMKQLAREIQRRVQTTGLKTKAEVRYYSGEDWDGGALVDAFKNEINQRDRNVTKQTVDITGKGVAMAGDITLVAASASPGGQGAGIALKIVGKGIQVGNKLVFTGIDWGIANKAKKLVAEARAGNPIARQQLFADSALYSKMYIAILAKEEHPLAQKFLVQRKYEEKDFMNDSISLKVMREVLMKDAGQKDEREVSDSFIGAYVDDYAGGAKKVVVGGGKVAAKGGKAVAKKVTDKVKGRETPYDESWRAPDLAVFDQASWDKVKADAIKAGLRDEPTGIGAALKKVSELILKEAAAVPPKKAEVALELILEYNKAADVVGSAKPVINDESKTHAGMLTFLANERSALLTASNRLRQQLKNLGVINTNWKPVAGGKATAASWQVNWASIVKETKIDADDAGVQKAWEALEKANEKVAAEPDKLKKRELQIKARDLIAPVAKALGECWQAAGEFDSVRTYIDAQQNELMATSRSLDATAFGGKWGGPAIPATVELVDTSFTSIATYAANEGYAPNAGKDVAAKIKAVTDGAAAVDKLAPSPAKRKARENQVKTIAAAVKAIEDYAAKAGETHADFKNYLAGLRAAGHAAVVKMKGESQATKFTVKDGVLPADFEATFDAAVAVGAIANATTPRKNLSEALKKLDEGIKKVAAGKTKAAKYKEFLEVAKLIDKAGEALTKAEDIDGGDNEVYSAYLEKLQKDIKEMLEKDPALKGFTDGSGVDDIPATTFVWKDADWQKMKKAAITAGLYPDAKTGIGESLTSGDKAYQDFKKALGDAKKNRKAAEDAKKALTLTDSMITTQVDRAKAIKKDNLKAYWEKARTDSQARLAEVTKWLKDNPAPTKP